MAVFLEPFLLAFALGLALYLRPWRILADGRLITPLLATLALLPWLWALPMLHAMSLPLRWSGAGLVVLMLGWPLAIPVLLTVGLITWALAPALLFSQALDITFWQGVLPATFALGIGALLRRLFGAHLFLYLLGRAFLGTVVAIFLASALRTWIGDSVHGIDAGLSLIAHWLMAWGDGVMTGMIVTLCVAFKPQWLATWSDTLYLKKK